MQGGKGGEDRKRMDEGGKGKGKEVTDLREKRVMAPG